MSRAERMTRLYEAIGIDVGDKICTGEIEAIMAGIGIIEELVQVEIDEEHVSVEFRADRSAIDEDLCGAVYNLEIEEKGFNLTLVDYDKIGMVVHTWFSPFYDIHFGGNGTEWDRIEGIRWNEIDSCLYRWRMIDTKGV